MKSVAIPFVLVLPLSLAILAPASAAQGSDTCLGAQGVVGPGPHAFDNSAATTGAEGQSGAACNFWGFTSVPNDVWFSWTAPASGTFIVTTCQQTLVDTKVAVYDAIACPSLAAPLWCDDDNCSPQGSNTQSVVPFQAFASQVYLIQIGASEFGGSLGGTGTFMVLPLPSTTVDSCATPATVTGTGFFGFDNNAATTGVEGQSNPFCTPPANATHDVWFSWTAPVSGLAQLDTCGQSPTDTKLGAYSGTGCPAATSLACGDDECGNLASLIQWPVTSGANYTLQIGGAAGGTQSIGTFRIDITPVPTNDNCATPDIANPGGVASYDNTMATTGAQGQGNPCGAIQNDLWWNWTASVNGTATIETCGTTAANTTLAVYVGGGCPAGAALACNDDVCGSLGEQSSLSISVTAGAIYRIQAGTPPGFTAGPAGISIFETPSGGGIMTPSCFPGTGGVISCPCGQLANPGGGCANFGAGATSGAVLNASGTASVGSDSVILTTTNHRLPPPGGVLNVFFSYKPGSATPTTGITSGAGVRCIGTGGSLKRLYSAQAFGGSLSKPGMGDLSVSARSASFPGHAITPPETRFYFNVYRDGQAGGPCGNTAISTNLTNLGSIGWGP